MALYRNTIQDGDLIVEVQVKESKGFFRPKAASSWKFYRNLSEEERLIKKAMDDRFMEYDEYRRAYVTAKTNVQHDVQMLQMLQMDNSLIEYTYENEKSLLEEREGIKYTFGKSNSGKGNGGNNGNGGGDNNNQNQKQNQQQNQNQNGNGNNNQQQNNQKQNKQQAKPQSLFEMLMNAKVVLPKQQ